MKAVAGNAWRRWWVTVMLLAVLVAPLPVAAQGPDDDRVAAVSAAAVELSRLERQGDLLTLHDRLHPDVRLVVSRAALAAWYAGPAAAVPTADPEILAVEFGAWTWPLTGQAYPGAATVVVRQAATQGGGAVEQVELQHFVFDGTRWRWFFAADQGFVDGLAAQTTPDAAAQQYGDLSYARVDLVWSEIYAQAGVGYASPAINPIDGLPAQTGCGLMTEDDYAEAFYCTLDNDIYYMVGFADQMVRLFGPYAWPHIVAHEWGHHVQALEGVEWTDQPELDEGIYAIEQELQADCLAGVYAQEAVARGWLSLTDLEDAYAVSMFAGDTPGTRFDDPTAHGSPQQRQQAFTLGLEDGLVGCNFDLTAD